MDFIGFRHYNDRRRRETLENKGFGNADSPEIGYLLIPSCESQVSIDDEEQKRGRS